MNVKMALCVAFNGVPIAESASTGTGNAAGRSENVVSKTLHELSTNDYIEAWVENRSGTQNITAENLNVLVEAL